VTRKIFAIIIAASFVAILLLTGVPFPYLTNNYRLSSFADQLSGLPLPPNTKRTSITKKAFGNFGTCGKHGDYLASFSIVSSLPLSRLVKYYSQFHVHIPETNNVLFSLFRGLGTHGPVSIDVAQVSSTSNYYIISISDYDYWPNDFRCW
jgi:hypothetical protein